METTYNKIPEKLKELKFCKIRRNIDAEKIENEDKRKEKLKKRKAPFEIEWTDKPYSYNEISKWYSEGGNYGAICGYNNLAVIDCDDKILVNIVKEKLPETFTVRTGRGGLHLYYFITDIKKKYVLFDKETHIGEVQWKRTQAVGPGSLHPNGKIYEVFKDTKIRTITLEQLLKVIQPFIKEIKIDVEYNAKMERQQIGHGNEIDNLSVMDIWGIMTKRISGDEFQGAHPVHGSETGSNLTINTRKNIWHCFRCEAGGGPLSAIAVKEGIIDCSAAVPGGMSKEQAREAFEIAREKYGLKKSTIELFQDPITAEERLKNAGNLNPTEDEIKEEIEKEIELPRLGRLNSEFITDIVKILKKKDILFYRENLKEVVEVGRVKHKKDTDVNESTFTGFISTKPSRFITLVEKFLKPGLKFYNKTERKDEFKPKSMSNSLAATALQSPFLEDELKEIVKIFTIPIPILYKENLTSPKVEYDERFKSWLPDDSPVIDHKMKLEEGKEIIDNILSEFCFQADEDKTIAIAGFITPFLRGLYNQRNARTPVIIYTGNRERVGKDYLAGITGILYEGIALEEPPLSDARNKGDADSELKKKIMSTFLSGRKRLHFSNNKGYINNSVFEQIITATSWSDRVLGRNEVLSFSNELEFSLSGNVGITFTADLNNRSRFCRLFYDLEDANAREFERPDLHKWILDNRGKILSAIYALVRNWIEKGSPDGKIKFASFPEWARVCGGIMESAGYNSPCKPHTYELETGGDQETLDMKKLFEYCHIVRPNSPLSRIDIRNIVEENPEEEIFSYLDFKVHKDKVRFGIILGRFIGRVLSDIRFIKLNKTTKKENERFLFKRENKDQENGLRTPKLLLKK